MTKYIQILGANKTGTSTLVGILNCHPQIYMMYEFFLDNREIYKGTQLYQKYPKAPRIKKGDSIVQVIDKLERTLNRKYKYVGDKNPRLGGWSESDKRLKEYHGHKIIFMVRDIRSWLLHNSTRLQYGAENDIIPAATNYIYYLMRARSTESCMVVKMEDLLYDTTKISTEIGGFLSVDLKFYTEGWWNKVGNYEDWNKRKVSKWWEGHTSSTKKPSPDITYELEDHKIWGELLPLFDKYYHSNITMDEGDLDILKALKKYSPCSVYGCYKNIQPISEEIQWKYR